MLLTFREKVIWLAAYLEGDGCFASSFYNKPYKYVRLQIKVDATDKDVLENMAEILGSIVTNGNLNGSRLGKKPIYNVTVSGAHAISWMMMLYQFMGSRRKLQIKKAINLWRNTEYKRLRKSSIEENSYYHALVSEGLKLAKTI